jgi:O-antigen ligase
MSIKLQKIINWLIIVYVFLLPWQTAYIFDEKFLNGAKWQAGTGVVYATELILWLMAVLQLIYFIKNKSHIGLGQKIFNIKYSILKNKQRFALIIGLWLFLAWSGLSIFWSIDKASAFYLWFHLLEGAALFFVILNSKIATKKLLWSLAAAGGLQGLLATGQFLTQTITANKFLGLAAHSAGVLGDIVIETADGRWLRAYGSLAHPNILGGFLVLGLIAASLLWISYWQSPLLGQKWNNSWPRSELKKFVSVWMKLLTLIGLSLLITAGLFFSFSRSAWLATLVIIIIGLSVIIAKHKNNSQYSIFNIKYSIFYLSPLILFLMLALIFSPLISARTDFTNRLEAQSNTERLTQIGQATRLINERPLTGVGLNNYILALAEVNPGQPAYIYQPIHNLYLLIFAELGAVGIILFLILLINIVGYALKQIKTAPLLWLNLLPLLAILIICFFDHYFWTQYIGVMLFWLSLTFLLKNDNFPIQQEIEL